MVNNYNVAVLSEKVAYLEAAIKNAGIVLPEVTSEDNGKTLQVVNGAWATGNIIPTVPSVINALDSTSTTDALSAAQGKALNDLFTGEDYTDTEYGNNVYSLRGKTVFMRIEPRTNLSFAAWENKQIGQLPESMSYPYSINYMLPLQGATNDQRNIILTVNGRTIALSNQSGSAVTIDALLRSVYSFNK